MTYNKPEVTVSACAADVIKGHIKSGSVVFDNRDQTYDLTANAYESDE